MVLHLYLLHLGTHICTGIHLIGSNSKITSLHVCKENISRSRICLLLIACLTHVVSSIDKEMSKKLQMDEQWS